MKQEWVLLRQWMVGCEVHWPEEEWRGRKQAVAGVTQFKDILLHCFKITMSGETLSETIATLNLDNNLWNFPVPAMPGKKNGQWALWRLKTAKLCCGELWFICQLYSVRRKEESVDWEEVECFQVQPESDSDLWKPTICHWFVCKIQPFYSCFWCFF